MWYVEFYFLKDDSLLVLFKMFLFRLLKMIFIFKVVGNKYLRYYCGIVGDVFSLSLWFLSLKSYGNIFNFDNIYEIFKY